MPTNLELKVSAKDFRKPLRALKKMGAEFGGTLKQKDTYFPVEKGLLKLRRENGSYELIYYNRDETGKKRWSNFEVLKLSGKNPEKFFLAIFPKEAVVEKTRQLYLYKGTRIHLDTVKALGKFIELETPVVKSKKEAEEIFNEIISLLELSKENQIRTSYRFLVAK